MDKEQMLLQKETYDFQDLCDIMEILRSDHGCPWDREQTHQSVRNNFIEETYEFIEGLDNQDAVLMCEELGDVLMQVVFHAQMAKEESSFTIQDVCTGVCKKLILRHPHIFADTKVKNSAEVLQNWDAIKAVEKNQTSTAEKMDHVSKALPALIRAEKLQGKAAKANFEFGSVNGALEKVTEETKEVEQALSGGKEDKGALKEEIGDLLFSVVNVARMLHINAEEALYFANDKFYRRFSKMEQSILQDGKEITDLTGEQLDTYWQRVKADGRNYSGRNYSGRNYSAGIDPERS